MRTITVVQRYKNNLKCNKTEIDCYFKFHLMKLVVIVLLSLAILESFGFNDYSNLAKRTTENNLTQVDEIYLPYEKCFVQLPKLDASSTVFTQKDCRKGSEYLYPPEYLPWQSSGKLDLAGVFPACTIGFGHAGQGGLNSRNWSAAPDSGLCSTRTISERKGMRSTWWYPNSPYTQKNFPNDFVQVLKQKKIRNIFIIGDSITVQVAKFFGCDLSRTKGVKVISNNHLLGYSNKPEQSAVFDIQGYEIRIHNVKLKVPCSYDSKNSLGCDKFDSKRKNSYNNLAAALHAITLHASADEPYLIIYNAGLHIFKDTVDWMIEPFVSSLLNFAKANRKKAFVLFRETSAQHFNARIGGCYDGPVSPTYVPGSYCCDKSKDSSAPYAGDWRNRKFLEQLNKEDPNWESYIGWIPFFNITLALYDLHVESNHVFKADCTHYIYLPYIFYPLWINTNLALSRLIDTVNKANLDDKEYLKRIMKDKNILKGSGKALYLMEDGKKRIFNDWGKFLSMGFQTYDVEPISDENLNLIPDGPPV